MIKRNEIRIKSSNKRRLLSDSELDDEADSNSTTSAIQNNPCKSITKIITLNTGFHFTKKLQNIKADRLSMKPSTYSPEQISTNEAEAIHLP
jgi:hypothetical protein